MEKRCLLRVSSRSGEIHEKDWCVVDGWMYGWMCGGGWMYQKMK